LGEAAHCPKSHYQTPELNKKDRLPELLFLRARCRSLGELQSRWWPWAVLDGAGNPP
jgi:hypothetical protein